MSQHVFSTTYAGRPVAILMGWDRPLQGFFMVVSRDDVSAVEDEILYSNLSDEALHDCGGLPPTPDHFVATLLAGFGLRVPPAMLDGIMQDALSNVGNRYVTYDQGGLPVLPGAVSAPALTMLTHNDTVLASIVTTAAIGRARAAHLPTPSEGVMLALREAIAERAQTMARLEAAGKTDTEDYWQAEGQFQRWHSAWRRNR